MNKLILTGLTAAILLGAAPAHAGGTVDVVVPVFNGFTNVLVGGFHVKVQSHSPGSGLANPWSAEVTKVPGYGTDKAAANQVALTFLRSSDPNSFVLSDSKATSGGTTNGAWALQAGKGDVAAGEVRFAAGNFANVSKYVDFGNPFSATVNLKPDHMINFLRIRLAAVSDPSKAFGGGAAAGSSGTLAVVPEPGALALLLPGLAPLGLILKRKRFSQTDEDEVII